MNIHIDAFDSKSVDRAIKQLQDYQKKLDEKAQEVAKRLAEIGYNTARVIIGEHSYSGETLSSLTVSKKDDKTYVVSAGSKALLFFEFGAGLNGGGHPVASEFGMGPGTYPGQTHAFDPNGWWFPTDDQNLIVRTDKNGQGWGHSYGNPPYMPMYNAEQEIKANIERIVKEVFSSD